jgi:indole-3-glycerol phosphate synthase
VIAELKRSSPSKGSINPRLDARRQSVAYEEGGASAISVLTEPASFGGSDADVRQVRAATSLPILKKDFHVSEIQLIEARNLGASAALVIVRAIEPARVASLASVARDIGLEILFEVRDENELRTAVDAGAEIIGVNNRDLETLDIDSTTVERILPLIPRDCVAIAESGYSTRKHIEAAARSGADAVLVGSSISAAEDPAAAVRELAGIPTTSRRR